MRPGPAARTMKDMTDVREISGMRASDHDRQGVVDRLRGGLDDGRLTLEEYLDRMGRAYQAVTYADLAPLCADLPATGRAGAVSAGVSAGAVSVGAVSGASATGAPAAAAPAMSAVSAASRARPWCAALGSQPGPLRVLWTIWLIAVSVNVVVWALVSVTTASLIYPWPLWVAGPYGAVLLALSLAAGQASARASRR
jgi:hypothetical protein